ncbi:MAG: HD domain-containing protein [Rhodospirillales bacterium]|nr:HD domain-containing protein [Rhodospirillales bacterium]
MENDLPDHFNVETDPVFRDEILPFIELEVMRLEDYERDRPADATYIFHEHIHRAAREMELTCHHLKWPYQVCTNLYWAMLPHDIGKRKIDVALWDMEDKPSEDIKNQRRAHTELGVKIVEKHLGHITHPFIDLMVDIISNHHENMDGSGFKGLVGDQLSTPVRLAAIIESFDGYQTWRPHFGDRDISTPGVLKRMREEKSALYDMTLFEAFAEMKMDEYSSLSNTMEKNEE